MKNIHAAMLLLSLVPSVAFAQGGDAAAGKKLWDGYSCAACHGKTGDGGRGPDLAGRGLSLAQFTQAVRHPWGVMPTFVPAQISDTDLANVNAYMSSLPKNAKPSDWAVKPTADMPHGQQLFHDFGCAQCHGPTFDRARMLLGGLNTNFDGFKDMVYRHTDVMREEEEKQGLKGANAPPPPPGRTPPPLRMGNFSPTRLSEDQLKNIYDWVHGEVGWRPDLAARFTAAGPTTTIAVSNNGVKGKGLTSTGVTVSIAIPAGNSVVSATGEGYKGVDGGNAVWQIARLAPQDLKTLTVTLASPAPLKGNITWAKPAPKEFKEAPYGIGGGGPGG